MAQHTPGPWTIGGDLISNQKSREEICKVLSRWRERMFSPDQETANANARLIAAAPDLLEACKEIKAEISNCIEFINDRTPSTDQQTISKLYSKLGKLIDKAEGRD